MKQLSRIRYTYIVIKLEAQNCGVLSFVHQQDRYMPTLGSMET